MKKIDSKEVMRLLDKIEKRVNQDPTARMPEGVDATAWRAGMRDALLMDIGFEVRAFRKKHKLTQETVDDFDGNENTLI